MLENLGRPQRRRFCQQQAQRPRARVLGVSLIELLVVFGLVSLIFTLLITLVGQSSALVSHGVQVIGLTQKARFTLDKMAPYVITAVADSGTPALVAPALKSEAPTADELLSYNSIQFATTEDFLEPGYSPTAEWDAKVGDRYFYEIYFDLSDPVTYTLEDGNDIELGRVMLRRYTDGSFSVVDGAVDPYPLGFDVQYFFCHRLAADSVEVNIHTVGKRKGPAGNQIDVFEQAQAILNLPSSSYN